MYVVKLPCMYSRIEPDPLVLGPVLNPASLEHGHVGHQVRERHYGPSAANGASHGLPDMGVYQSTGLLFYGFLILATRGQVQGLKINIDFGCVISTSLIKHLFLQQYLSTNIH